MLAELYNTPRLSNKEKGDKFEAYSLELLRLTKPFATWYLYNDFPRKETYNLPTKDHGIDIVGLTNDTPSQPYFVQCKWRAGNLTYKEVSTFFAESVGRVKSKLILVTNAIVRSKEILKKVESGVLEIVSGDDLLELDPSTPILPTIIPRDYQQDAITAGERHFIESDVGILKMFCGTGKTFTALWIAITSNPTRMLYVVPSILLLEQTRRAIKNLLPDYEVLTVSFKTEIGNSANIRAVTARSAIVPLIRTDKRIIVLTTYQSSIKYLANLLRNGNVRFDFAIFDEIHKSMENVSKFKDAVFKFKCRKRLFMTATPKILGEQISHEFGKVFFNYTLREAIDNGNLCDYRINVLVDPLPKNIRRESVIAGKLVEIFTKRDTIHCLTFHTLVRGAEMFADILNTEDEIKALTLSGKLSAMQRKSRLDNFVDLDKSIMCSARVLQEGVDIPSVDTIVFADPKSSKIDIIQTIGRGIRLDPDVPDKICDIYIPICVSAEQTAYQQFEPLIRLLSAMKDEDCAIEEKCRQAINSRNKKTTEREDSFNIISSDPTLNVEWSVLSVENVSDLGWYDKFSEVKKYVEANDNQLPDNEHKLHKWCLKQNHKFITVGLPDTFVELLSTLPGWKWTASKKRNIITLPLGETRGKMTIEVPKNKVFEQVEMLRLGYRIKVTNDQTYPITDFDLRVITNYLRDSIVQTAPTSKKKLRDPRIAFYDGERLKHNTAHGSTEFEYNLTKNVFIWNKIEYKSLNSVTRAHYDKLIKENGLSRKNICNAWAECRCYRDGKWIPIESLSALR